MPGFAYSFGVLLPHLMEQFSSDRQSTGEVINQIFLLVPVQITEFPCCSLPRSSLDTI